MWEASHLSWWDAEHDSTVQKKVRLKLYKLLFLYASKNYPLGRKNPSIIHYVTFLKTHCFAMLLSWLFFFFFLWWTTNAWVCDSLSWLRYAWVSPPNFYSGLGTNTLPEASDKEITGWVFFDESSPSAPQQEICSEEIRSPWQLCGLCVFHRKKPDTVNTFAL